MFLLPITKHLPIKLQLLFIRAVPLEYPLHRQLTIPRVCALHEQRTLVVRS